MSGPNKSQEDGHTDRRMFLKTFGVAATGLTAGCTATVGDWVIGARKKRDRQPERTTTSPTETSTDTPGTDGSGIDIPEGVTQVEAYDPEKTPRSTLRYELTDLELEVNRAEDKRSGGANDLELAGHLSLGTNAEVESGWTGPIWYRDETNILALREGESQMVNMRIDPVILNVYDIDYSEQKFLTVGGDLWDRDGDAVERIGREHQRHLIREAAGEHSLVFSTGKSKITARYSISVS